MKRIITISREFGASGGTIGHAVASRLGYEYYDKEIILRSAQESNLDIASIEKWDEKIPMNFGFAQSLFDFYNTIWLTCTNQYTKGAQTNCLISADRS